MRGRKNKHQQVFLGPGRSFQNWTVIWHDGKISQNSNNSDFSSRWVSSVFLSLRGGTFCNCNLVFRLLEEASHFSCIKTRISNIRSMATLSSTRFCKKCPAWLGINTKGIDKKNATAGNGLFSKQKSRKKQWSWWITTKFHGKSRKITIHLHQIWSTPKLVI